MKENDFIVYKGQTLLVEFKDREGYWWCTDDDGNDYYVEEDDVEKVLNEEETIRMEIMGEIFSKEL